MDPQKKENILARYGKSIQLVVESIENDSSEDTEVRILHLREPVSAVGSNPTADGLEMKVSGKKVYVAADDVDKFIEKCEEKDGALVYKGDMHLDVSKPSGREVNGVFTITKPAKIWLTSTKFSRRGGQLRQKSQQNLSSVVSKMFAGGKTYELGVETPTLPTTKPAEKQEPEVVANEGGKKK